MVKRVLAAFIATIFLFWGIGVYAYDLPQSFWSMNAEYGNALEAKDYNAIAWYGSRIVDLIINEPSNEQTDNIMGSRAYETAFAYYFIGDYANAVKYFKIYIPYGERFGWSDGVRIATEFVKQLKSSLELYIHTSDTQLSYGAKNEPDGVLYGQVSEEAKDDESMILLYLEYGMSGEFDWARVIFNKARESGKSIELALNFPNQGDDARTISASDAYLAQLTDMLSEYSDVPVFLRIGAEMNIWGNYATPEEFKRAFNIVASSVHYLPNVAVVWSVAHTDRWKGGDWNYSTDDFYPGDENVDYAGINIYCNKYFEGKRWSGVEQFNEICFKTGYSSDPVLMIKDFVEKYGGKKPIIISECGSAYYTQGEIYEEHHTWAAARLKEIYSYIPMVYPQVKLMAYFNKKISYEYNWYDLNSSPELQSAYDSVTLSPWFIQKSSKNSAAVFFKKADSCIDASSPVTVSTYPHLFGSDTISVDYYLNGQWLASSSEVPYTVTIPAASGVLRITATGSNGAVIDREYTLEIQRDDSLLFWDMGSLMPIQQEALKNVYDRGIIAGYEDGSFMPYNNVTRAEFATMICRMMKYSANDACSFDDAKNHWASKYIKACSDTGAISGVGGNLFAPDDNVTVEQALKIITVVCGMADSSASYPDGFIEAALQNGLTENTVAQSYSADLTRIDAAVIMSNFKAR